MIYQEAIVADFESVSLEQFDKVKLLNRKDFKYVTPAVNVGVILKKMAGEYLVLEVEGRRIQHYETGYYDTPARQMYLCHHDGRLNREKIRIRSYMESSLSYFEIKCKTNNGYTRKRRVEGDTLQEELLGKYTEYNKDELQLCLYNRFSRMTFANRQMSERVTVDLDLHYLNPLTGKNASLEEIAIIEIKSNDESRSRLREILLDMRIKPMGFSKYCIGSILTDPQLKSGLFKKKLMKLDKLTNYSYGFIQ
jgi:hypothetical protein